MNFDGILVRIIITVLNQKAFLKHFYGLSLVNNFTAVALTYELDI
jgi:hypothetical protein